MTCYDGFGNLADGKHRFWNNGFRTTGGRQILFYYEGDHNWYLSSLAGGQLTWDFVGNTAGFGNLNDGRPIWTGYFSNTARAEILFYYPGDHNWWLGSLSGNQLNWTLVGNTAGFGKLTDGKHPIWIDDFNVDARSDILFYYQGDHNWWLGSFSGGQLIWRNAGNTAGFGNLNDGRPIWTGYFSGNFRAEILFYTPDDHNWWLGTYNGAKFIWQNVGNTAGFGQISDGRPFWTGYFRGAYKTEVLFYYPGDHNWWLGSFSGNQLAWSNAGNTAAAGFGQISDGRPFWIGDFNWDGKADVLFYSPSNGNWRLGSHNGSKLAWSLVGNTGQPLPHKSRIYIHIKVVATTPQAFIDAQIAGIKEVFNTAGIRVEIASIEDLTTDSNLNNLRDVDAVDCASNIWPWPSTSSDQNLLFQNRNFVGQDEIVVYIVRTIITTGPGITGGCATHPPGKPGCMIVNTSTPWVMAHEVGHVLGLGHVDDTDRLMNPDTGWTNLPPDLDQGEANWMDGNSLTKTC